MADPARPSLIAVVAAAAANPVQPTAPVLATPGGNPAQPTAPVLSAPIPGSNSPIWNTLKEWLTSIFLPLTGGSTILGSLLGFIIYLVYCHRVAYMPALSISKYADLFFSLTLAGSIFFVCVALVPFLPGCLLFLTVPRDFSKNSALAKELTAYAAGGMVISSLFFGYLGLAIEAIRSGQPSPVRDFLNTFPPWILVLLTLGVTLLPIVAILYAYQRSAMGRSIKRKLAKSQAVGGKFSAMQQRIANVRRLVPAEMTVELVVFVSGATILSGYLMFHYAPLMGQMAHSLEGGNPTRWIFPAIMIGVIGLGNYIIGSAREVALRRSLPYIIGFYFLVCTILLSGPTSERLMKRFGLGAIGPIELTVLDKDLNRIPAEIRETLDTQSDLTTGTFAVKGLYLVLRIGDDFRWGILRDPSSPHSEANPITSAWNMPQSVILTWRVISPTAIVPRNKNEAPGRADSAKPNDAR